MKLLMAQDENHKLRVREGSSKQNLMKTMGASLMKVLPEEVEIALEFRDDLTQQHGFIGNLGACLRVAFVFRHSRMLLAGIRAADASLDSRLRGNDARGVYSRTHAGIVAALADTACGYAAFSLMAPDAAVLTLEYKINLLSPAIEESLIASGKLTKPGRTLIVAPR